MKRAAIVLAILAAMLVGLAAPAGAQATNASPCAPGQPPGRPPGVPPGPPGSPPGQPPGRPPQYPPASECAIRLSSNVVAQGGTLTVAGEGFAPGAPVTVTMHSDPVVLGTTTAGAGGEWSVTARVPEGAALGAHTIQATDGVSTLSAPLRVVAAAASRSQERSAAAVDLPRTGIETAAMVALALALIGLGTVAIAAARRRREGIVAA